MHSYRFFFLVMRTFRIYSFRSFQIYYIVLLDFPGGSMVKNRPANAGDADLVPWSRRSPGEGNGNSL